MRLALLLLLCAFTFDYTTESVVSNYKHTVCVTSDVEQRNASLLAATSCYSLDDVLDHVKDSTLIQLNTSELNLNTLVVFEKKNHISIVGFNGNTTITCLPSNSTRGAGLAFIAVQDLTLVNLTFLNCGALHNSTTASYEANNSTLLFRSTIYILNCTDVALTNIAVRHSLGNGLAFFDTHGTVRVENSAFEWNRVPESDALTDPGGGGVYVEFTYCSPGHYKCNHSIGHKLRLSSNITYTFHNCHFESNNASTLDSYNTGFMRAKGTYFQGLGRGGGLSVFLKGLTESNIINVSNCSFRGNSAIWGGGLYVAFQDSPKNNTVIVNNSTFENNVCYKHGGGGADVGYLFFKDDLPQNNSIIFQHCTFTNNTAKFGGGIEFYSSQVKELYSNLNNTILFLNCTWRQNKARYGSAVDMSPLKSFLSTCFLPVPVFENCTFVSNWVLYKYGCSKCSKQSKVGKGTVLAVGYRVQVRGTLRFENNNGSAMYMTSSSIEFTAGANVSFINNSGENGGAIALIGFSAIEVDDNSLVKFVNNSAIRWGGAVYVYSINKHDYISSRSCFIQYIGSKPQYERNIFFTFIGNQIARSNHSQYGCSIFTTSMTPCHHFCNRNSSTKLTIENAFHCIANFTYMNSVCEYEISTSGGEFLVNGSFPLKVIPGKEFELPIAIQDDFSHKVPTVYHIAVNHAGNSTIEVDRAYSYISDKRVELYGHPNNAGIVVLSKTDFREISLSFGVHMQQCPPGYILSNDSRFGFSLPTCICSINSNYSYYGLYRCKDIHFQAYLHYGYWMGYDSNETEYGLLTAYCPTGFCFHERGYELYYLLPPNASREALDKLVCGTYRTGILCGKCRNGSSVHYHTENFNCGKNEFCKVGWLFYIISELVPVTVIFVLVMIFNVSFTSGATNGFIFFAQVMDSLQVTASGFIWFPSMQYTFTKAHRFIYRLFNLDFFSTNELSFCLWEGATTLDVVAFKFVTVAYALLLVLATILLMNFCNVYRWCPSLKVSTVKSSIIHGLSAFLIMCYAQCTKVSFNILEYTGLCSRGYQYNRTVVFRQGEVSYFSKEHLPYALPALFCLVTIVAIPPILLISYPLCYKILALFKLSESKYTRYVSKFIPLLKLKPLLDSLQSCFKDNLRFFAGLYFVYRFTLLATSFTSSLGLFYTVLEIQLIVMLAIHSLAHPYEKQWHNILDTLIFADLAIINGMTFYNYTRVSSGLDYQHILGITISIQLVLIYLPMLYIVGYVAVYTVSTIKGIVMRNKKQFNPPDLLDDDELPARLTHSNSSSDSEATESEYHSFQDQQIKLQDFIH